MKIIFSFYFIIICNLTFSQEQKACGGMMITFDNNTFYLTKTQEKVLDSIHLILKKELPDHLNYQLVMNNFLTSNEVKEDEYIGVKRCTQIANYFIKKYNYKPSFFSMQIICNSIDISKSSGTFFYLVQLN